MTKTICYVKTFFLSFEFLILCIGVLFYSFFEKSLKGVFETVSLSEATLNWAVFTLVAIVAWTLKDGVGVLFPGNTTEKVLHEWPDYWQLEIHFKVGVFNGIFYLIPCVILLLIGRIGTFTGMWIFLVCALIILVNALSFYMAKIAIKSHLLKINKEKTK